MKHQYFADSRDFIKYALLLDLAELQPQPASLLSILMLTPNDDTLEGSIKRYDRGLRRRDLFKFLRGRLDDDTRDVSHLRDFMAQVGVEYQPYLDDGYFENAGREAYFSECAMEARRHSLVFFDPDIGLQTGTVGYMRRKGIEKYLMYADVAAIAQATSPDCVFVVYQHLQRNKTRITKDLNTRCRDLCQAVGSSSTTYVTDCDVAFLVTSRETKSNNRASHAASRHGVRHGLDVGEVKG